MFDESLLDSSPSRVPVLKRKHWLTSFAVGVVVFVAMYFGLPFLLGPEENKILVTQSAILGVLVAAFVLMLCYVAADTKHLGLGLWFWIVFTFIFNLPGFIVYLIYTGVKTGNWKRVTLPIAYMFEVILVGTMVLVPLIYTEALPKGQLMGILMAPPPPPPPPPPPVAAVAVVKIRKVTVDDIMRAPTVIPKTTAKIKDEQDVAPTGAVGVVGGVPGGVPGGTIGGVLGGVIGGVLSSAVAPPPPPPKPSAPKRIRVGGQVESAKLIFQPRPEYPPLAKMARIQGSVRLEAVISKDGTIQDLKVLSGHPLLVKSALEAVQRWRYQPTLLNGEPVEVITEVDVNFTLSE
jgi:periplasmic protein TonB